MAEQNVALVGTNEVERYLMSQGMPANSEFADFLTKRKVRSDGWSESRRLIAVQQLMFKDAGAAPGTIDGLIGPGTRYALEQWQNLVRDTEVPKKVAKAMGMDPKWPREKDVEKFYGKAGTGLTMLDLPYRMKLAWDLDSDVDRISIHEKCAASAHRVLTKALEVYGIKEIRRLGLDLFGGCIANPPRFKRGSSTSPSMHNWGIAIDFDPDKNQLRWGSDRARLAGQACYRWWDMWEAEGWVSLGRERNYDWMHVQAANL